MSLSLFTEINWLAVLVAAIAYFAIGAIWYAPLFGKKWVKYHRIDMNDPDAKKGVAGIMLTSFLIMFIVCIGLSILVVKMDLHLFLSGVKLGLLTGICFSAAAISITYVYLKKPVGLHMIDGLYHVVGHVAAALILCAWQ
ncbi:MAG TPA: DUF1761 domain-containing protein [Chitinophagaceae bacterium]